MYNEISILINELMYSVKPAIHDKQSQPQLIATVRAWFRVQQQNYTTNPQLYSIARQLALILAKHIPLYDSPEKQLQGAFTLLFPRSTVSIPPELKLSQEAF